MSKWAVTALWYAIFVSLGGFVFGYDASVISGAIGFISQEFELNDYQIGLVVTAPTFSATLAALTVTPLADQIGRKKVLILLAALYSVSAIYSALAADFTQLVIARAIGGYAFGSLMLAPVYIAETSPAQERGLLVSVNQLNIVIGFSASYFMNYYLLNLSSSGLDWVSAFSIDTAPWRAMLMVEAFPAILWLCVLFLIPESPRWLMMQGRSGQAKTILSKIMPKDDINQAVDDITNHISKNSIKLIEHIKGLFQSKVRFILFVGILLAIVQQATGINAVFFYAPTIFEQSGVGTNAAFEQAVWVGLTNLIFTIVAMMLIDKLGRKPLMIIGLVGVSISLLTTSYGFHKATFTLNSQQATEAAKKYTSPNLLSIANKKFSSDVAFKKALREIMGPEKVKQANADLLNQAIDIDATLVLYGIIGFVASFAVSLGPVMWVMLSEIFPNHLRAVAMAFTGIFNSGTSSAIQFLFPIGLTTLGASNMFLIYGLFALFGLGLVFAFLPETKGKSLEELEDMLVNNRSS